MLTCRRALGNVYVKGRNEAVPLHEAFEFDAPDLVSHKRNTRAAFEQAQRLFQEKLSLPKTPSAWLEVPPSS